MIPAEPAENYLDDHSLYRGVKRFLWEQWEDLDQIGLNFFMKKQAIGGLSVDWSKYNEPSFTLRFLNSLSELEEDNLSTYGIIDINVGDIRRIINENSFPIKIKHDPNPPEQPENDGHTLLLDILFSGNIALVKEKLAEIATWASNMKPVR